LDPGKPRKTCVEMAGRRNFPVLTYNQLCGIRVKAVIGAAILTKWMVKEEEVRCLKIILREVD
jgi:hypothetical protein